MEGLPEMTTHFFITIFFFLDVCTYRQKALYGMIQCNRKLCFITARHMELLSYRFARRFLDYSLVILGKKLCYSGSILLSKLIHSCPGKTNPISHSLSKKIRTITAGTKPVIPNVSKYESYRKGETKCFFLNLNTVSVQYQTALNAKNVYLLEYQHQIPQNEE